MAWIQGEIITAEKLNAIEEAYNQRFILIEDKDVSQDNSILALKNRATNIELKDNQQDTRLTNIESKNTTQDTSISNLVTRVTNVESVNTTQNTSITSLGTRITATETKNTEQDTRLTNIENVLLPYDTGWVAPTMETGYKYEGNGVRRIGNVVYFNILLFSKLDGTAIPNNTIITTLPIGFRPSVQRTTTCVTRSGGTGYFSIRSNGEISVGTATGANGVYVPPISYLI